MTTCFACKQLADTKRPQCCTVNMTFAAGTSMTWMLSGQYSGSNSHLMHSTTFLMPGSPGEEDQRQAYQ